MKILYVAKHDSGDNDDEGAVGFALERLGHTVVRIQERDGYRALLRQDGCDFCLFHKWADMRAITQLAIPRVFWYFDLVRSVDPFYQTRLLPRERWMSMVMPHCLLGFCTDGDWASQDTTGKLVRLNQGCDERVAMFWTDKIVPAAAPIVFTGTAAGGERLTHINRLKDRYGERFEVVGQRPRYRLHGRKLAKLFAAAKIAVAPIQPVTDSYWSNRVYLTTGFGGFLLHPRCTLLERQYRDREEIVFYNSVEESFDLIDYYLAHNEEREQIRRRGHQRALREHTYRHRCEQLVSVVEEALHES